MFLTTLCFAACIREEIQEPYSADNQQAGIIYFTHRDYDKVNVTTKATLDLIPESRIQNMFIYIFDSNDKRIYAHYFDQSNKLLDEANISNKDINCWQVTNRLSNNPNDPETSGYIKIKSPHCTDGTIYVVANIDADMVNISPEKLNTVRTVGDLENLTASLNQEITSRNGYFPMSFKSGIDINDDGTVALDKEMQLVRLDAKVMVNFRVATDNELEKTEGEGEDAITTKQTLKEFIPESWRVVNIPKGSYVFEKNTDYDDAGYFDTEPVVFETKGTEEFTYTNGSNSYTVNSPVNGFSFYMVENRETASASTGGQYHLRDKREKDNDGRYTTGADGGMWVYAPEDGTYLEVKGEVVMVVDVSSEAKKQQLSAAVTYYIHLGDLTESMDNYSISRNTIYNYTITIKGVSEIETEVTTSNLSGVGPNHSDFKENETGATGQVYVAKESIYTFDAHYGQRVFCFDAAYIDPDNVTWYVKTPFGKEGIPDKVGDTEVPAGMDYKWVHFLVNNEDTDDANVSYLATGYHPYSHNNLPWPGDPYDDVQSTYYYDNYGISEEDLMDVVEFTDYIKTQKRLLEQKKSNDFKREFDKDWLDWYNENNDPDISEEDAKSAAKYNEYKNKPWWRDRIYMTVFVDEFYYEVDPITGTEREGLWKEFVNQPNRIMHILCDNEKSFDRESSATGSVITLRQRSIQTPYNLENASTAWGCETVDEFRDSHFWFFSKEESMNSVVSVSNIGNTSKNNGLYNTARLWSIINSSGNWAEKYWNEYLDYERVNDFTADGQTICFLKEDFAVMRYATMPRNRDNNGNGKIDSDELRWYIASLEQLQSLYIGELGLSDEARLYPDEFASQTGKFTDGVYKDADKWRAHIISSSSNGTAVPIIIWAEEGMSTSDYRADIDWEQGGVYSIRSVRNLGLDNTTVENLKKTSYKPEDFVTVQEPSEPISSASTYKFDLRNVNKKSIRFYTTKELEPANEKSEMARCYYGFETGELLASSTRSYEDIKVNLEANILPCPEGWRLPNVREGSLMHLYCNSSWWNGKYIFVSSYHSLGDYGLQLATTSDNTGSVYTWSWNIGAQNINMSRKNENSPSHIRCVKDSHPDTW